MDLNWWNAYVSTRTGEVLAVYDWVHDLNSFTVYPIGVNDPFGNIHHLIARSFFFNIET